MSDKFAKTHPWRCDVLVAIKTTVMGHVIEQSPGERMARTRREMEAFREAVVKGNGEHSCGPVCMTARRHTFA